MKKNVFVSIFLIIVFSLSLSFCEEELVKEYHANGNRKSSVIIGKNTDTVLIREYYEHGNIRSELTGKDGDLNGPGKVYDEKGNLRTEVNFSAGKKEGIERQYYEDGKIEAIRVYKNGKEDGNCKRYHKNGKVSAFSVFKNGRLEGAYKGYWENGKIKDELYYKNGKLEGSAKSYYENGQLESESFYKNGLKDGNKKLYYPTGKLRGVAKFSKGIEDGTWIMYDENGNIEKEFTNQDRANSDLKEKATKYLHDKKYKEARECIEKVISNDPDYFDAMDYGSFGLFFMYGGQYQYAKVYYEKAVSLDPESRSSCYGLADAYERMGKVPQAITYYEKGNEINDYVYLGSASSYHSLGMLYGKLGQNKEAIRNLLIAKEQYEKMSLGEGQYAADCKAAAQSIEQLIRIYE